MNATGSGRGFRPEMDIDEAACSRRLMTKANVVGGIREAIKSGLEPAVKAV